jgi:hypothetical protein
MEWHIHDGSVSNLKHPFLVGKPLRFINETFLSGLFSICFKSETLTVGFLSVSCGMSAPRAVPPVVSRISNRTGLPMSRLADADGLLRHPRRHHSHPPHLLSGEICMSRRNLDRQPDDAQTSF